MAHCELDDRPWKRICLDRCTTFAIASGPTEIEASSSTRIGNTTHYHGVEESFQQQISTCKTLTVAKATKFLSVEDTPLPAASSIERRSTENNDLCQDTSLDIVCYGMVSLGK